MLQYATFVRYALEYGIYGDGSVLRCNVLRGTAHLDE